MLLLGGLRDFWRSQFLGGAKLLGRCGRSVAEVRALPQERDIYYVSDLAALILNGLLGPTASKVLRKRPFVE